MPGWHEKTRELRKSGKLQVVGLIQEQHAERCTLFQTWHAMKWPVLVDSLNLLGVRAVPLTFLIDEHGIVRKSRAEARDLEEFLAARYDRPANLPAPAVAPNLGELGDRARTSRDPTDWRAYADALFLTGESKNLELSVEAYRRALELENRPETHFRLGVALRRRYESKGARASDFRDALTHWGKALALVPGQYIWRRRIQQYGPRLAKPYSFYDWVHQARRDLAKRGEPIPPLRIEPSGAEFAQPSKKFASAPDERKEPDPTDALPLDEKRLVGARVAIAPARVRRGEAARVHVHLSPDASRKVHWNNEAGRTPGETVLWLRPPPGVAVDRRWRATKPSATTGKSRPENGLSSERRELEFEVRIAKDARFSDGRIRIPAYVTYYVCEDVGGVCFYFRQNLDIDLPISE